MMMNRKRLDRVVASLNPRQRVLLWMEEAHRFGSHEAYLASLGQDLATEDSLSRLIA